MKKLSLFLTLLVMIALAAPISAFADEQPEMIAGKMAMKFTRGMANSVTGIVELPKQTILTVREMGGVGYVVGPLKGIGMTVYRTLIGAGEMVFFLVPQPGYYDPMIDPAYVWEGWETKRETTPLLTEETK